MSAADGDESSPIAAPACSDSLDNDGDGFVDYPGDDGCTDAADDSENG